MSGFVEYEYVRDLDQVTPDNTIGVVEFYESGLDVLEAAATDTPQKFDPRRLRRALLAADEEFDVESSLVMSLIENEDGWPFLVLRPDEHAMRGIVLAGRAGLEDGDSA